MNVNGHKSFQSSLQKIAQAGKSTDREEYPGVVSADLSMSHASNRGYEAKQNVSQIVSPYNNDSQSDLDHSFLNKETPTANLGPGVGAVGLKIGSFLKSTTSGSLNRDYNNFLSTKLTKTAASYSTGGGYQLPEAHDPKSHRSAAYNSSSAKQNTYITTSRPKSRERPYESTRDLTPKTSRTSPPNNLMEERQPTQPSQQSGIYQERFAGNKLSERGNLYSDNYLKYHKSDFLNGNADPLLNIDALSYVSNNNLSSKAGRNKYHLNFSLNSVGGDVFDQTTKVKSRAFVNAMKALQDKVKQLEREIASREEEKIRILGDLEREEAEIKMRIEEEREEYRRSEQSHKVEIAKLQNELTELKILVQIIEKEKETSRREQESVEREVKDIERKFSEEKGELGNSLKREQRRNEELSQNLAKIKAEKERVLAENEQLMQKYASLERENQEIKVDFNSQFKEFAFRNEYLQKEMVGLREHYNLQLNDFQNELGRIEESYKNKLAELEQIRASLEAENNKLTFDLEIKQSELDGLKIKLEEARLEIREKEATPRAESYADHESEGFLRQVQETIRQTKSKLVKEKLKKKSSKKGSRSSSESGSGTDESHRKSDASGSSFASSSDASAGKSKATESDDSDESSQSGKKKRATKHRKTKKAKKKEADVKAKKGRKLKPKEAGRPSTERSPMRPDIHRMLEGLNTPSALEGSSLSKNFAFGKKLDPQRMFTSPAGQSKGGSNFSAGGYPVRAPSFGQEFKTTFVDNSSEGKLYINTTADNEALEYENLMKLKEDLEREAFSLNREYQNTLQDSQNVADSRTKSELRSKLLDLSEKLKAKNEKIFETKRKMQILLSAYSPPTSYLK